VARIGPFLSTPGWPLHNCKRIGGFFSAEIQDDYLMKDCTSFHESLFGLSFLLFYLHEKGVSLDPSWI